MRAILLCLFVIALSIPLAYGCAALPSQGRAERAAENLGLDNVHVTGRRPAWGAIGGCKDDDLTLFHVVGKSADGTQRHIEVCAPLIGGYTVRS